MAEKKTKNIGLGRGLDSLLDDNAPNISTKPSVVKRTEGDEYEYYRKSTDELFTKEGVKNVKKIKRTWS